MSRAGGPALALFDLDHTLIPFDSGLAWTRFLTDLGELPDDAELRYLDFCRQYVAGTLDIHAMHRAMMAPLTRVPPDRLAGWVAQFEQAMAPRVPPSRQALVQRHLAAGDLCVIVTATTRFIAEPFARLFGVADLVATEAARHEGLLTGEIAGDPCFREHKRTRVGHWLAQRRASLEDFEESWFYSDSASDLPLLSAVTHPIAVDPDPRLRSHALAEGWMLLEPA
ncbi:MAG: HAD-IB family hydrolase [Rubrivivax sp.]|nr:HAD-IB family hydrolase [Rubrivivax sp.]MDH5339848.1 HAD-IB family hydrolase [Rubrivivax sp.]